MMMPSKNALISAEKFKKAMDRFLEGTLDHFAWRLPSQQNRLIGFILKLIYSRIDFKEDQAGLVKNLPEDACVVYVNKFKSPFEYLFSYARFSALGIPCPGIAVGYNLWYLQSLKKVFQILCSKWIQWVRRKPFPDLFRQEYLERKLLSGEAIFLSLIEKHDFYQRFVKQKTDPLKFIIELQERTERPIFLVPLLFFYTHAPASSSSSLADIFFGSEQRPGKLRTLFKSLARPDKMFAELSRPINLPEFLKTHPSPIGDAAHAALILRRDLLTRISRHRQSTTGPVVKSFEEIKQSILTNDELAEYMKKYARRKNVSLAAARRRAVEYFDEIAARYRPGFIVLCVRLVKWFSRTVFNGIDMDAKRLEAVKQMSLNGPVIFMPCHRSHIDSMIMLSVMYEHHLSPPHFFAGKNLSFWPLGPLLRMAGAFFVRRTFKGSVFYTKVFSAYIFKLLEEGFHITVFIEGSRSRSGKLLAPQAGMINILLNAFEHHACKDLIFVPVYIGYERVPEEKEYLNEIQGGQKKPESALRMLKIGQIFRKRFGKIYVKINDPIGLNDYMTRMNLPQGGLASKQKNFLCRELANTVMHDIDRATIVTPRPLVAAALLNSPRHMRSFGGLVEQIQTYLAYLSSKKAPLSDALTRSPQHFTIQVLNHYAQANLIFAIRSAPGVWQDEDTLIIRKSRRQALEYYKNNCITHFVPGAYTALSILARDDFAFNASDILPGYRFLSEMMRFEFIRDHEHPAEFYIRKTIKAFIDSDMLLPHPTLPETYAITSPGYRKLRQFASFLTPFLESYRLVLKWLAQNSLKPGNSKDRSKKILALGKLMVKNGEIERPEALSGLNIENALACFAKLGLDGRDSLEEIRAYDRQLAFYSRADE